ncbi:MULTISPECIES: oligosaccharide flippase family protein [Gordonia]|uniref:Oligosaccharide flippase family protein n=1 Tax=Gordonia tangerina TaxID=2911060 RepID=A0ABS9DPJ7_9ACTN|nr:oligosaccharide flippase family protein [Gordonia tangerina]MCF3940140.1 oligosaccharide flippase family protein [Gordonia tangerina]
MTRSSEHNDPHGPEAESEGSSLRRNIGNVAAASAVALVVGELITFVQTIALARLLSPAEVGVFVAGTVLALFLGNFVEGGLRSALIHRDDKLIDSAETVFWVTAVSGFLMSLLTLAVSPVIGLVFDNGEVGLVAAASSGVLFLYSFTNVPEAMLQREFSVKRRLIVGPSVAAAYATVAVSAAAAGWGVWSMVAGIYASYVVWVATVWLISDWRPGRGHVSVTLWRELARYGLPLVFGMIGARVQSLLEAVVVGRGLSETDLGYFRYGQRISMIPVRAILEVGAVALFPAFSRISAEPERMKPAYLRALRWATVGAAALSGLMIALGQPAVVILFGEQWREAGAVVVAMAGLGFGKAIISVSEEAIKGGGRTGLLNWYTAVEVTLGIVLLLVFIGPFGVVGAGLAASVTALLVGATVAALAKPVVGFSLQEFGAAVVPQVPCAVVATAACAALEHFVLQSDSRGVLLGVGYLAVDTLVFGAVYLAALAVVEPSVVRVIFKTLGTGLGQLRRRV